MANLQVDSTANHAPGVKQSNAINYSTHWEPQLFLSAESVKHFKCVKCKNVPKIPHECDQNHLFCEYCVKITIEQNGICPVGKHNIAIAKRNGLVFNIINDLEIRCIHSNVHHDNVELEYENEGNVDDTKQSDLLSAADRHCNWMGSVKDIAHHLKQNCRVQRYIDRERAFHELQQQNASLLQKLTTLQDTIYKSRDENTSLQQNIEIKMTEIDALNQTVEECKAQLQQNIILQEVTSSKNTKLQKQINEKNAENEQCKKYIQDLEHKLKKIQMEHNILVIKQRAVDKYKKYNVEYKSNTEDTQPKYQSIPALNMAVAKGETEILLSHDNIIHDIDKLVLEENAVLTVEPWNIVEKSGGFLNIRVKTNIIMKKGSKITVSGLGYKGGKVKGTQGGSYISVGKCSTKNNNGGGGGGQKNDSSAPSGHGAGASYGSKGVHGWSHIYGVRVGGGSAGDIYGDETLEILHRGSGGGCSGMGDFYGGDGGGIINIECEGMIIMEKDAVIEANGCDGHKDGGGGGSGGSIRIVSNSIEMDDSWWTACKITAIGGNANGDKAGKGGDGRICCLVREMTQMQQQNITPAPHMG